jgi:hypothetical protein
MANQEGEGYRRETFTIKRPDTSDTVQELYEVMRYAPAKPSAFYEIY